VKPNSSTISENSLARCLTRLTIFCHPLSRNDFPVLIYRERVTFKRLKYVYKLCLTHLKRDVICARLWCKAGKRSEVTSFLSIEISTRIDSHERMPSLSTYGSKQSGRVKSTIGHNYDGHMLRYAGFKPSQHLQPFPPSRLSFCCLPG
jgi:hypothetical protein